MLLLLTLNIFHTFFRISIVNFEQVNVCWILTFNSFRWNIYKCLGWINSHTSRFTLDKSLHDTLATESWSVIKKLSVKRNATLVRIWTKFSQNVSEGVHLYYNRRSSSCKFTKKWNSFFTSILQRDCLDFVSTSFSAILNGCLTCTFTINASWSNCQNSAK